MTDTSNNEHTAVPHTREEQEHDPEFREQDSLHDAETEEDTASGGAPASPSEDGDDDGKKSSEWERPEESGQPTADADN